LAFETGPVKAARGAAGGLARTVSLGRDIFISQQHRRPRIDPAWPCHAGHGVPRSLATFMRTHWTGLGWLIGGMLGLGVAGPAGAETANCTAITSLPAVITVRQSP